MSDIKPGDRVRCTLGDNVPGLDWREEVSSREALRSELIRQHMAGECSPRIRRPTMPNRWHPDVEVVWDAALAAVEAAGVVWLRT